YDLKSLDPTSSVWIPLHPFNSHVVANEKWCGSQLVQEMQGKIKWYVVTEADLVTGNGYRKRNSSNLQGIIVVEKIWMTLQKFTVLNLGMVLLPVASQIEASCLIIQLVQEQTVEASKNSLLRKKQALLLSEPSLLRNMQQIPGVGKVKAPLLLQKFPSIQQLSNASTQELEQVVRQQIHAFFTQPS
uniref:Fanconi anemia core complex-associated protein 24 pseudonuclease domain-containing protein n=1 Tax=Aotus nancymaae TaxID=37293 RepID=A0A2K5BVD6_AOTNA